MLSSLPVFTYHSISRYKDGLCVSPELFDEHCRTLANNGWRGISLHEAEEYFLHGAPLPLKSCLFTFDDGYLDNYVYAEPILRRHGHHGVIFPVLKMVESSDVLRPTMEDPSYADDPDNFFASLDRRERIKRCGRWVERIQFCSWQELRHMQDFGNMCAAPHSMRHDRVIRGLSFCKLNTPRRKLKGFFSGPPYDAPWGFPVFDNGHFLAERAYTVNPKIFALVEKIVPQNERAALRFLAKPGALKLIRRKLDRLPWLGKLESHAAQRKRIAREFARCQRVFKKRMGKTARTFCWPWGDSTPLALAEAQKAGFCVFFTTTPGPNPPGNPLHVHRMSVRGGSGTKRLVITYLGASRITALCHAVFAKAADALNEWWKDRKREKRLKSRQI